MAIRKPVVLDDNNIHGEIRLGDDLVDASDNPFLIGSDVDDKADKVPTGTEDNFVSLDAEGNIQDSGHDEDSFEAAGSAVLLDQTAPQTIINGIPVLDSGRVIVDDYELIDKKHVDDLLVDYSPLLVEFTPIAIDYELVIGDVGHMILADSVADITITVPDESVPIPAGALIAIHRSNTGDVIIDGAIGVVINHPVDRSPILRETWSVAGLVKLGENKWTLFGDLADFEGTATATPSYTATPSQTLL